MEATLTNNELEIISKQVSEKIYNRITHESFANELEAASRNYVNQMIKFYVSDNVISNDAGKVIKPILEEYLKETKVVEDKLMSYMNTDHFKKLELKHLKIRVEQLERELYEE